MRDKEAKQIRNTDMIIERKNVTLNSMNDGHALCRMMCRWKFMKCILGNGNNMWLGHVERWVQFV